MPNYSVPRVEKRVPMELGVQIAGHSETPGVEMTFTQNVSSRGARVLTARRWRTNDMLMLSSAAGDFRSPARVAYCHKSDSGFAIGVEILEPGTTWVVKPPMAL
ncbi:MAG: PilZ domain-containing protein [Candidatus Acidiferrales bacterium]